MTASSSIQNPRSRFNEFRLWLAAFALLVAGWASVVNYFQGQDIRRTQAAQLAGRIESDVKSCLVGNNRAEGTRAAIAKSNGQGIFALAQLFPEVTAEQAQVFADTTRAAAERTVVEEIRDRDCETVDGATPELVERIREQVTPTTETP